MLHPPSRSLGPARPASRFLRALSQGLLPTCTNQISVVHLRSFSYLQKNAISATSLVLKTILFHGGCTRNKRLSEKSMCGFLFRWGLLRAAEIGSNYEHRCKRTSGAAPRLPCGMPTETHATAARVLVRLRSSPQGEIVRLTRAKLFGGASARPRHSFAGTTKHGCFVIMFGGGGHVITGRSTSSFEGSTSTCIEGEKFQEIVARFALAAESVVNTQTHTGRIASFQG